MKITGADVVVVGLGTMGSTMLWRLARRGVWVIGIEHFTPGHDRVSGHGESRIIHTPTTYWFARKGACRSRTRRLGH